MSAESEDPQPRRLIPSVGEEELRIRQERLQELGWVSLSQGPFDDFAQHLAEQSDTPTGIVNLIPEDQYFLGLHSFAAELHDNPALAEADHPQMERRMARDRGFCMNTVARRTALAVRDVNDYPQFYTNPVVDEHGIRAYLGVPLIDPRTRLVLGTVCVLDHRPRRWTMRDVNWLHQCGFEAMRLLNEQVSLMSPAL